MASIVDDRGFNQGFVPTRALEIRSLRRCQALVEEMDLTRPKTIVELGCGTGDLSFLLSQEAKPSGSSVVGTDLCKPFIEQANHHYHAENLSYRTLDLNSRELGDSFNNGVDYIVGNGILHHLYHNLDEVLPRLRNHLNPGGKLIFWEPNLKNPYVYLIFSISFLRKLTKLEPDEMAFTQSFISQKLEQEGFAHNHVSTRDFLIPNLPTFLIQPVIQIGRVAEKVPLVRSLAQSLFISAQK